MLICLIFICYNSISVTVKFLAVILEHFDRIVGNSFVDCVSCLIGFANNKCSHRISLKAIALIRICEDRLAEVIFLHFGFITLLW